MLIDFAQLYTTGQRFELDVCPLCKHYLTWHWLDERRLGCDTCKQFKVHFHLKDKYWTIVLITIKECNVVYVEDRIIDWESQCTLSNGSLLDVATISQQIDKLLLLR